MGSEIIRLADIEAVYSEFDGIVEKRISATGKLVSVFAYEDGALRAFKAATICGARRLYEMPMGYWRGWHEIMLEEKDREPEWANTLQGLCDSQEKLEKKDEELALADQVIVASEFSKSTLIKAPSVKAIVETIPYGAPKVIGCVKSGFSNSVLKVIYVGALTQRKGISYLLRAVEIMGKGVRLSILGAKQAGKCLPLEKAMAKHLWIGSASHEMVLREIRKNDVLVLPSLFEGFGLVILEALSQGVPVIATTNTGGPDIIDDGSSGYIIPIRSAMELAGKLEMLRCDKSLRQYMSENAIVAAKRYSWERYMKSFYASIVGGDLAEQSHCSGSFNS